MLVVDDDASLRGALESTFANLGYRVLTAGSADAAYALLTAESADAVLLDVRLPGMSGLALSLAIVHRWPELEGRIAFMTGDADAPDVRPWLERGHFTTIRKPFTFAQISNWLAETAPVRERRAMAIGV